MKKQIFVFLVLVLILSQGANIAQAIELTLVPPQPQEDRSIAAGYDIRFVILFTNPEETAADLSDFETVTIQYTGKGITEQVTARSILPLDGVQVPASGFYRQSYQAQLPENLTGTITMSIPKESANQVMFTAVPRSQAKPPAVAATLKPSINALKDLQHPFLSNFSTYEPVYFLFGLHPGIDRTKFQLSFKYRLFTFEEDRFSKTYLPWLENLHFAYTQTSFWDLSSSSAPFEDSRYMPELFYYDDNIDLDLHPRISLGFQAGYQHESNGRGGALSRSTNHAYVKPIFVYSMGQQVFLKFAPKAWIYVHNEDENNPDLFKYRGYIDLEAKVGSVKGLVLETHLKPAEKGTTLQMDLSFPIKRLIRLEPLADFYLHAQYFNGYAENLLNYRQREQVFRLGLSLVR